MGGRGRILILAGVGLLLVGVVVAVLLLRGGGGGAQVEPTATPPPRVEIVVAVQRIQRGQEVVSGTVSLVEWPAERVPPGAYFNVEDTMGMYAAFDVPPGVPLLPGVVVPSLAEVALGPSDLPLKIQSGKVAVALPISTLSSVAHGLMPGDRVDVLASFRILDLDEEFQTKLTNGYMLAVPGQDSITFMPIEKGGRDRNSVLGFPAIEQPSEEQRPRMVAQLMVQNMTVLGVGDWMSQLEPAEDEKKSSGATSQQSSGSQQPTPTPQMVVPVPEVITVIADPQDALVLKFLREVGASMDLALRSAADTDQTFSTESVTVQYLFARFDVAEPPKLPFGIEGTTILDALLESMSTTPSE